MKTTFEKEIEKAVINLSAIATKQYMFVASLTKAFFDPIVEKVAPKKDENAFGFDAFRSNPFVDNPGVKAFTDFWKTQTNKAVESFQAHFAK